MNGNDLNDSQQMASVQFGEQIKFKLRFSLGLSQNQGQKPSNLGVSLGQTTGF